MGRIRWPRLALIVLTAALFAQLFPDCLTMLREWPRQGEQTPSRAIVQGSAVSRRQVRFLIYLPKKYSKQRTWPLLLFLHGKGQRGDDIQRVAKIGPPNRIAHGKQLPMIVVSPQCPDGDVWQPELLLALLEHLHKEYRIDSERIYIGGYSMGAYGGWELIAMAPERFAAAVPVAGGGDVDLADRLTEMPIWAFHGACDAVIPLEESQRMVEAIQTRGDKAKLTILEDEGHNICDAVFSRDDVYAWLLEHRRKGK